MLVGDLLCFGFGLRLLMFGVGVCCLVLWWFGLLFACTVVMCTLVGGWVDLVVDCSLWLCWLIVVRLSFVACLIATVTGCGVCCLILALVFVFGVGELCCRVDIVCCDLVYIVGLVVVRGCLIVLGICGSLLSVFLFICLACLLL